MIIETRRKVIPQGNSSYSITLPKGWSQYHALKKGDELVLMGDEFLVVVLQRKCTENMKQKIREILSETEERIDPLDTVRTELKEFRRIQEELKLDIKSLREDIKSIKENR